MFFIVRVSPDGNPDPRTEFPDQLRQEFRITGMDALKIDGINRSAPSRSDGQPDRPPSSSLFCQGGFVRCQGDSASDGDPATEPTAAPECGRTLERHVPHGAIPHSPRDRAGGAEQRLRHDRPIAGQ